MKILNNKIKNKILLFLTFLIKIIGDTCMNCRNYNEVECGIVCDDCARKYNIYQNANRETFFCASYKGRRF